MPIIHKYLTREILKYFCVVLILVVSIYVIADYLENMDEFIFAEMSLLRAFGFVLLRTPFMTVKFIPVALLLSVLITFGLMSKNNELIVLKSSGISLFYLLRPVLLIGVLFGILLFFISEVVVPITMVKANTILQNEIRKGSAVRSKDKNIWLKGKRKIVHIQYYQPAARTISGVTSYHFDKEFQLIKRIDAQKGTYGKAGWVLFDVMEQVLDKETGQHQVFFHEKRREKFDFLPADLKKVAKKSEEMNFKELLGYIKRAEAEGYDATGYKVDLYAKTAFPFICIIMCVLGTGLAAKGTISRGLPKSISLGIGTAFLYWVFFSFCLSLGYGELFPPFIAAWVANLIFSSFAVVLLLNAE